jgi:hypothetical protein
VAPEELKIGMEMELVLGISPKSPTKVALCLWFQACTEKDKSLKEKT